MTLSGIRLGNYRPAAAPVDSNLWIGGLTKADNAGTENILQYTVYYQPITISIARTYTRLGWLASTTGFTIDYNLAIYDSDEDGKPSTLLVQDEFTATVASGWNEVTVSIFLRPGVYWFAIQPDNNASVGAWAGSDLTNHVGIGNSNGNSYSGYSEIMEEHVLPNPPVGLTLTFGNTINCLAMGVREA